MGIRSHPSAKFDTPKGDADCRVGALPLLAMTGTDCLKLLTVHRTTNCSLTLIRFAALSTFPSQEKASPNFQVKVRN